MYDMDPDPRPTSEGPPHRTPAIKSLVRPLCTRAFFRLEHQVRGPACRVMYCD